MPRELWIGVSLPSCIVTIIIHGAHLGIGVTILHIGDLGVATIGTITITIGHTIIDGTEVGIIVDTATALTICMQTTINADNVLQYIEAIKNKVHTKALTMVAKSWWQTELHCQSVEQWIYQTQSNNDKLLHKIWLLLLQDQCWIMVELFALLLNLLILKRIFVKIKILVL